MEPAGLAIGIVGLAGLFSSCLDIINRVELYRSFNTDSQDLNAQFAAHRLRFERWGQHVGFESTGQLRATHHHLLDNPAISLAVEGLLNIITRTFKEEESDVGKRPVDPSKGTSRADTCKPSTPTHVQSRWQKVNWALRGKAERTEKVALLGTVVQQLHDLISTDHEYNTSAAFSINTASILGQRTIVPS